MKYVFKTIGHYSAAMTSWVLCILLASISSIAQCNDLKIPDLGDAGGGLTSPAQEYELGQRWKRMFRAQVPTSTDPHLQAYVEQLINKLVTYSALKDKRLDVLVVENPALNAFAVPGGVIGVHTGLFNFAKTEQQFSSVLAHELAHLSQRHYARTLEQQKSNSIVTSAALLASILIAATSGGDAGIAAISATQAGALESQLRFSRQMEREADRVGMETMLAAEMNPYAMTEMFEQMLEASRFQRRPPEFLLTHPVTESRINDSRLRAQQHKRQQSPQSLEYQLLRARVAILHATKMADVIGYFKDRQESETFDNQAARYGLAMALLKAEQAKDAHKIMKGLVAEFPQNLYYLIAMAEIEAAQDNFTLAISNLENLRKDYPRHHPLNIKLAEIFMLAGQYKNAISLLEQHVERRQEDDYIWYLLAESYGLAGDIYKVHVARAEYFLLNGIAEKAQIQLVNALKYVKDDKFEKAKIEEKLKHTRSLLVEMRR